MDNTASIRAGYNLRTFCSEVVVLVASAFVLSIASPGFMSANGVWPFAFIALIPVFAVIRQRPRRLWLSAASFSIQLQERVLSTRILLLGRRADSHTHIIRWPDYRFLFRRCIHYGTETDKGCDYRKHS